MPLAFSPDQDRAVAPVDIVELDGDSLGRPEAEARKHHEHGVVAPADRGRCPGRVEQFFNLVGFQITRQGALRRLPGARNRCCEIPLRLAAPEQEAEQIAKVRRPRLVPRRRAAAELAQEVDDVVWRDVVEVAERLSEPEGHEALEEADAVVDRCVRQPALVAEVALVLGLQAIQWRRRLRRRHRSLSHASVDKSVDEPLEAVLLLVVLVRVHPAEGSGANLRQGCVDELAVAQATTRDLAAEQGSCSVVSSDRKPRIALIGKRLQEPLAVRFEPIRRDVGCCGLFG